MINSPKAKPFVFVLMPFSDDFNDVYQFGIKRACEEHDAYCERVDEQMFDGTILERIFSQIARADVIVADMTGKNANVFYETGYAHALKKRVILLTKSAADIPFDLKHYTHLVYGSIGELARQLAPRLAWALSEQAGGMERVPALRYCVQGRNVEEGATVEIVEFFDEHTKSLTRVLQLDVINETNHVLREEDLDIVVVIDSYTGRNSARLQDGRYWHVVTGVGGAFPGTLRSVKLHLEIPHGVDHLRLSRDGVRVSLRETSKFGAQRTIGFTAKLVQRESLEFYQHFVALPNQPSSGDATADATAGAVAGVVEWNESRRT